MISEYEMIFRAQHLDQHKNHQQVVVHPNGLVMDFVMMITIMLVVNMIKETAATINNLGGMLIALFANV